ncbi:hypothetical protein MKEN_00820600 [Mycena kentingensis (nom. inval.)]|nr:hypothetical protein MKEN_00820600 [Mycena kentingensis (nom. inval.)]
MPWYPRIADNDTLANPLRLIEVVDASLVVSSKCFLVYLRSSMLKSMSSLTLIVAATKSNGIGHNSKLPWRLPKEMAYFARVTSNAPSGACNAVIMGRNTWESIPAKFRPLKNRVNVIVSRNASFDAGSGSVATSLQAAVERAQSLGAHKTFMIGGASLYAESLALGLVDRILLTRILSPEFAECDVFMPEFRDGSWVRTGHDALQEWVEFDVAEGVQEESGVLYEFQMWVRSS